MTATIYAMLACKSSNNYTQLALDSFIKNTKLNDNDEFYLIDNDGITVSCSGINIIKNDIPQSFAKNSNDIINRAQGKNVVILSNDVVFTPNWDKFLHQYNRVVMIPSCNQTHNYAHESLKLESCMTIDQYTSEQALNDIAKVHTTQSTPTFFERPLMSFYVFRLPYEVYSSVGLLDERFGVGGGEDVDYRIRAILAGYSVKFTNQSYLLHFGGKSTWHGVENSAETEDRNQQYFQKFVEKWGSDLANLCLCNGDIMSVIGKYQLETLANTHNFSEVIKLVHKFSHS